MKTLPEEDNIKLFFEAMENFERKNIEASAEMTDRLIAQGSPEGYTLKGIMAVEKGDTIRGKTADRFGCRARQYLCRTSFNRPFRLERW